MVWQLFPQNQALVVELVSSLTLEWPLQKDEISVPQQWHGPRSLLLDLGVLSAGAVRTAGALCSVATVVDVEAESSVDGTLVIATQ